MKREIKFRAWNKNKSTMVYSDELNQKRAFANLGTLFIAMDNSVHEFGLMQFTGLKDKNGKEIYEGDIVAFNYADYEMPLKSKVEFNEGAFYPVCEVPEKETFFEVIGNIYENPELL